MITGLDHVHIICGDVEETAKYFKKVFDGRELSRSETGEFPRIRMDVKGVIVFLLGTTRGAGQITARKGNKGLDHFGFQVKDFDETIEELKKRGGKFSEGPGVSPSGNKFAFIEGPDGIHIELIERK